METLLYEKKTEKIRQAAYDVHQYFGIGFLEKVYENSLKYQLEKIGFRVEQQKAIPVRYIDDYQVGEYYADLLVDNEIIIELKVAKNLEKIHFSQLMHYLKATNLRLGLLINFGTSKLEYKRIIN